MNSSHKARVFIHYLLQATASRKNKVKHSVAFKNNVIIITNLIKIYYINSTITETHNVENDNLQYRTPSSNFFFLSKYMDTLSPSPSLVRMEWREGLQDSLVSTSFLA